MKKTVFFAASVLALAGLASCSGNNKNCNNDSTCCNAENCPAGTTFDHDGDMMQTYTGVLPAADADGVRYTLTLKYDKDDNFREGDYGMIETFVVADSTATTGYKDTKSFRSEGDFTVGEKDGKKFLRLVQDVKDSQPGSNAGPIYLLADSDTTLTMVNAELQPAENSELNYTLTLSK